MSIFAYVGTPGSGKSYDVVANQILPALKQGRKVVTNIPLLEEEIRKEVATGELVEFPMEQVQGSPEVIWEYATPGCVLVLDEIWRLFPAGLKANNVPEPFKKLLAEHRHMVNEQGDSMQIVLVTQDLAQISAFARQLIETTFNHTKLTAVGMRKAYRIDVYQGPQSGPNYPKNSRIREIFGKYDPKVYKLYKSHTMSESGEAGANENPADARANVWRRPMIWVGLAFVVIVPAVGFPLAAKAIKNPSVRSAEAQAEAARTEGSSRPSLPGPTLLPGQQPQSVPSTWRVCGYIRYADDDRSMAWITNGADSYRVPWRECRSIDGEISCRWEGKYWSESGRAFATGADPIG